MKAHALSELGRRTEAPPISWLMATALARPQLISLAAGFTDNESLPVKEVRELLKEHPWFAAHRPGGSAIRHTAGDPGLRRLTAQRSAVARRPAAAQRAYFPERIIITNGSQQMLYMVTEALCDPGDIVLVEDPTYFVYLGIVQSHGLRARGVRMEKDGLDLAHLEEVLQGLKRSGELRRVKLLYLVSYYQNPTGVTTSFDEEGRRAEVAAAVRARGGTPHLPAGRRRLPRAAVSRRGREIGPGRAEATASGSSTPALTANLLRPARASGLACCRSRSSPRCCASRAITISGRPTCCNNCSRARCRSGRYEKHLAVLRKRYAHKARVMRDACSSISRRGRMAGTGRGAVFLGAAAAAPQVGSELEVVSDGRWPATCCMCRANSVTPMTRRAASQARNAPELRRRHGSQRARRHRAAGRGLAGLPEPLSRVSTHSGEAFFP